MGSGGYKMSEEYVAKKQNNFYPQHLLSDTPTQDELYIALGLEKGGGPPSSQAGAGSNNENYSKHLQILRESRQEVFEKNYQLMTGLESINAQEKQEEDIESLQGYDSDPEIHTYQDKIVYKHRLNRSSSYKQETFLHTQNNQVSEKKSELIPNESDQESKPIKNKEDFIRATFPKGYLKNSSSLQRFPHPDSHLFQKVRSQSIRAKKLQEMVDQKKKEEEDNLKIRFKAKEVPRHVQEPLYERIKKENEERREQVKRDSRIMTQKGERPFSFYLREKEEARQGKSKKRVNKKNDQEREEFVFKANKIPWHVHVDLWKKIQEEENTIRKERIAKHAQQLAMSSKMPERMEKHERLKQVQQMVEKDIRQYYKHTHRPATAQKVPNFEKLQSDFQSQLDRKKQQKRTTQPQPFNFQKSSHGVPLDYMDVENEAIKIQTNKIPKDLLVIAKQKLNKEPKIQPASTKKWDANREKLRKERELKKLQEEEKIKEEILRQDRKEAFKSRVLQSKAIQDNTDKLRAQSLKRKNDFKRQQQEQEKKFQEWKAERLANAANQPLLVERPTKRDLQLEKLKTLQKMNKILTQNGVKNKEQYFNEDERNMLKDIEFLQKQGYGDDFEADEEEQQKQ